MPWSRIGKWLASNWKTAVIFAAIFWFALSNVLGGPANLLAKKYLDLARGWYQVRESERATWAAKEKEYQGKLADAKGKLAAARNRPARPAPTSATETAARFRELGYDGRAR